MTCASSSFCWQCEQASSELNSSLLNRRSVVHQCFDVLHTYATVVGHLPPSIADDTRTARWQQWLQEIVCKFSSDAVKRVQLNFEATYGRPETTSRQQIVRAAHTKLQVLAQEQNIRLIKVF